MKTKNIKLSLLLCGLFVFTACNLDVEPHYKYTVDTFWDSPEGTEAAMNGCYNALTFRGLFGESTPLLEETCTPNAYSRDNILGFDDIASGNQTPSNCEIINSRWSACYTGIGRCNTHLNRLAGSAASADRKKLMEGETKFLRALYYYMLTTYYNGVPLILEEPKSEHAQLARAPRQQVVDAILQDLKEAFELLSWKYSSKTDLGRPTKGAVLALKAKLLLFEASPLLNETKDAAKWQAAADAALEVINNEVYTDYDLYPNYRDLFLPVNEYNCESIFDIQYSKASGARSNSFNVICVQYRSNSPLLDLINAYETTNGAPINAKLPYENRDPRLQATVFYPGSTFLGKKNASADDVSTFTGFAMKKMSIYNDQKRDSSDNTGETNYIFLRYADIILAYAEAQNELDPTPSHAVYDAINRVRLRAGLDTFAYDTKTQREMRNAIYHERRIEFAGEGFYYTDIRRWRLAEIYMNATIRKSDKTAIAVRAFDPDRDYWWPIPEKEMFVNRNLVQNPEY